MTSKNRWNIVVGTTIGLLALLFVLVLAVRPSAYTVKRHGFTDGGLFGSPAFTIVLSGDYFWQERGEVVPESTWRAYEVGDVWEGLR